MIDLGLVCASASVQGKQGEARRELSKATAARGAWPFSWGAALASPGRFATALLAGTRLCLGASFSRPLSCRPP